MNDTQKGFAFVFGVLVFVLLSVALWIGAGSVAFKLIVQAVAVGCAGGAIVTAARDARH